MLRENIFIVLRAGVPRVAHSLALVVLKSLLVVSCVQTGGVEGDSATLSAMVCEICFVLLCSKFPLHNAFAKDPFAIGRAGQGPCLVALLLPLFNLHFYFCALETVAAFLCIALRMRLSRTTN